MWLHRLYLSVTSARGHHIATIEGAVFSRQPRSLRILPDLLQRDTEWRVLGRRRPISVAV
jgi:hypothetical protein